MALDPKPVDGAAAGRGASGDAPEQIQTLPGLASSGPDLPVASDREKFQPTITSGRTISHTSFKAEHPPTASWKSDRSAPPHYSFSSVITEDEDQIGASKYTQGDGMLPPPVTQHLQMPTDPRSPAFIPASSNGSPIPSSAEPTLDMKTPTPMTLDGGPAAPLTQADVLEQWSAFYEQCKKQVDLLRGVEPVEVPSGLPPMPGGMPPAMWPFPPPPFGGMPPPFAMPYPPAPWGHQGWSNPAEFMRAGAAGINGTGYAGQAASPKNSTDQAKKGKQKQKAAAAAASKTTDESEMTTIMLRNLPNDYTRQIVLDMLDKFGFEGQYDFVYVPRDFARTAGLGYAFVNMSSHEVAMEVMTKFTGFNDWGLQSSKVCEVAWGHPLQGYDAHVARYRDSPLMHPDIPDDYKPVIFVDGKRADFPAPTKKLRRPRMKGGHLADPAESCARGD
mmetsp:Transcript_30531/g.83867  ORF Transcript_30531/g.83867 Transcript_30531/m.83867 type:complete len:446 (+) Transcript_30531:40-1377(+)|eukprot:CAMPEP_0117483038 /NCGR_PEP_ID=MMETSP0784-20121206/13731_1 /TAXON_ID=39447 /ORGANISM="" /LENGTH=445 /DNA_ID=CAMNT_0005277557 /DNA_START=35 /DNA_END=1372 /DNA_ORIENTATION=-